MTIINPLSTQCLHGRATANPSNTTDQVCHYCPDCGKTWTTYPNDPREHGLQYVRAALPA
jgi:predicted RNA-binding Zn-ribbon protein involved in translation (DUF1610 family)